MQNIVFPVTFNGFVFDSVENSFTLNGILYKISLKDFTIRKADDSSSMFTIVFEISFIKDPFVTNVTKVSVIEGTIDSFRCLVEDSPKSRELIIFPVPFIGNFAIFIV